MRHLLILFCLLAIVLGIIASFRRLRLRSRLSADLREKGGMVQWPIHVSLLLFILGMICLGFAWNNHVTGGPRVLFLLDCSQSMLAKGNDNGTRLQNAKASIRKIVSEMPDAEFGLITFAGTAFVDFPPSLDHEGFEEALSSSGPGVMYVPGSSPEQALRQAEELAGARGCAILLSDCEINSARDGGGNLIWRGRRIGLSVLLCGVPEVPETIPAGGEKLVDSASGNVVLSVSSLTEISGFARLSSAPLGPMVSWDEGIDGVKDFIREQNGDSWESCSRFALLAMLFLILSMWSEPIGRWCSARLTMAVLLLFSFVAQGEEHAEIVERLRGELENEGMSRESRAVMLSNLAGHLCAMAVKDEDNAGNYTQEAFECCRKALKLVPGLPQAANNLELSQRIAGSLPVTSTGKAEAKNTGEGENQGQMGAAAEGRNNHLNNADVAEPKERTYGTWRDLQQKKAERNISPAKPGVKPW